MDKPAYQTGHPEHDMARKSPAQDVGARQIKFGPRGRARPGRKAAVLEMRQASAAGRVLAPPAYFWSGAVCVALE